MKSTYVQKSFALQKVSAQNAASVIDASSQSESLQRKADMANSTAQRVETPRPNNTGMPDNLKAGIESLSGFSMDDVRVHYNSPKPATVQALAYTQGTDIHVAPGQEKHLPHEAWHVAQQMAGRVSPTTNINGMPVNDNAALEHEADVMGEKAVQCKNVGTYRKIFGGISIVQCTKKSRKWYIRANRNSRKERRRPARERENEERAKIREEERRNNDPGWLIVNNPARLFNKKIEYLKRDEGVIYFDEKCDEAYEDMYQLYKSSIVQTMLNESNEQIKYPKSVEKLIKCFNEIKGKVNCIIEELDNIKSRIDGGNEAEENLQWFEHFCEKKKKCEEMKNICDKIDAYDKKEWIPVEEEFKNTTRVKTPKLGENDPPNNVMSCDVSRDHIVPCETLIDFIKNIYDNWDCYKENKAMKKWFSSAVETYFTNNPKLEDLDTLVRTKLLIQNNDRNFLNESIVSTSLHWMPGNIFISWIPYGDIDDGSVLSSGGVSRENDLHDGSALDFYAEKVIGAKLYNEFGYREVMKRIGNKDKWNFFNLINGRNESLLMQNEEQMNRMVLNNAKLKLLFENDNELNKFICEKMEDCDKLDLLLKNNRVKTYFDEIYDFQKNNKKDEKNIEILLGFIPEDKVGRYKKKFEGKDNGYKINVLRNREKIKILLDKIPNEDLGDVKKNVIKMKKADKILDYLISIINENPDCQEKVTNKTLEKQLQNRMQIQSILVKLSLEEKSQFENECQNKSDEDKLKYLIKKINCKRRGGGRVSTQNLETYLEEDDRIDLFKNNDFLKKQFEIMVENMSDEQKVGLLNNEIKEKLFFEMIDFLLEKMSPENKQIYKQKDKNEELLNELIKKYKGGENGNYKNEILKEVENKLMRDHLNGYMKECNQNMNQTFDILSKIAGGSLNATKKEQWKTKKSELTGKYESSFIGET